MQMDGETNKVKFIGHFCYVRSPASFCTTQTLWTLSCSMTVHSCEALGGIVCITRHQLGVMVTKMATK